MNSAYIFLSTVLTTKMLSLCLQNVKLLQMQSIHSISNRVRQVRYVLPNWHCHGLLSINMNSRLKYKRLLLSENTGIFQKEKIPWQIRLKCHALLSLNCLLSDGLICYRHLRSQTSPCDRNKTPDWIWFDLNREGKCLFLLSVGW